MIDFFLCNLYQKFGYLHCVFNVEFFFFLLEVSKTIEMKKIIAKIKFTLASLAF